MRITFVIQLHVSAKMFFGEFALKTDFKQLFIPLEQKS